MRVGWDPGYAIPILYTQVINIKTAKRMAFVEIIQIIFKKNIHNVYNELKHLFVRNLVERLILKEPHE